MNRHPVVNALLAEGYIVLFALGITYIAPHVQMEAGPLLAIPTVLSLLVFSAATMGYLFLYTPLTLALSGQHKEALKYFLQTLFYFALIAAVTIVVLLFIFQA